jgi:hypothetical protein
MRPSDFFVRAHPFRNCIACRVHCPLAPTTPRLRPVPCLGHAVACGRARVLCLDLAVVVRRVRVVPCACVRRSPRAYRISFARVLCLARSPLARPLPRACDRRSPRVCPLPLARGRLPPRARPLPRFLPLLFAAYACVSSTLSSCLPLSACVSYTFRLRPLPRACAARRASDLCLAHMLAGRRSRVLCLAHAIAGRRAPFLCLWHAVACRRAPALPRFFVAVRCVRALVVYLELVFARSPHAYRIPSARVLCLGCVLLTACPPSALRMRSPVAACLSSATGTRSPVAARLSCLGHTVACGLAPVLCLLFCRRCSPSACRLPCARVRRSLPACSMSRARACACRSVLSCSLPPVGLGHSAPHCSCCVSFFVLCGSD